MIKSIFLFPDTAFLKEKWWNRLASVIFWLWVGLIFLLCVSAVGEFLTAPRVELLYQIPMVILMIAFIPSIIYRLILYVAFGSSWE